MHDKLVRALDQRRRQRLHLGGQRRLLVQRDFQLAVHRRLDARAIELGVALRQVRVTHRQQAARHLDGVVHLRAHSNASVVEVAAVGHGRHTVDDRRGGRCETHASDVQVKRHLERLRHRLAVGRRLRVLESGEVVTAPRLLAVDARHIHAGVEVRVVHANRRERRSAVRHLVHRLGVRVFAAGVLLRLVDGRHLNLLAFRDARGHRL